MAELFYDWWVHYRTPVSSKPITIGKACYDLGITGLCITRVLYGPINWAAVQELSLSEHIGETKLITVHDIPRILNLSCHIGETVLVTIYNILTMAI